MSTEPSPPRLWYGHQTIIADSASLALTAIGALAGSTDPSSATPVLVALTGVVGYAFAAPIVHIAHGQLGAGLADFGLRLGVPLASAAALYALGPPCSSEGRERNDGKCVPYIYGGLAVGALAASVIDAAVLGYQTAPLPKARDRSFVVFPMIAPNQASLAVLGSF